MRGSNNSQPRFWHRVKRLTDLRQEEKRQMQEYVGLGSGHMEFLVRALDGPDQAIAPPPLTPLSVDTSPELEDRGRPLPASLGPDDPPKEEVA